MCLLGDEYMSDNDLSLRLLWRLSWRLASPVSCFLSWLFFGVRLFLISSDSAMVCTFLKASLSMVMSILDKRCHKYLSLISALKAATEWFARIHYFSIGFHKLFDILL